MTKLNTFISGLNAPYGLTFHNGLLYVSNTKSNTISQITADGRISIYIDHGLSSPTGMVFDECGNLYVANSNTTNSNGFIIKISQDKHVCNVISGLCYPTGLAMDKKNNLYVANNGATDNSGTIMKLSPKSKKSTFVSGLHYPNALTFDKSGILYVSCDDHTIKQITPRGIVSIYVSAESGFQYPNGLAFYGNNLYVSCYGSVDGSNGTIYRVSKTRHNKPRSTSEYIPNLPCPTNIAVDCQGYLYVGYQVKNEIQKTNKPLIKNWITL